MKAQALLLCGLLLVVGLTAGCFPASLPPSIQGPDYTPVFNKTKIVKQSGSKTQEVPVFVAWGKDHVRIVTRWQEGVHENPHAPVDIKIFYSDMADLTYEYSKHWRVVSGILVSPWLLFSKRKHHWLSFTYGMEGGRRDAIVLRIDKREEVLYRRRVPAITGLELTEHIED